MNNFKYVAEFELKTSVKMLFPYLATASGLQEWFADKVITNHEKEFHFIWEGSEHFAKVASRRTNAHIKFVFEPEPPHNQNTTLEFRITFNELTQSTFLKVIDYSDMSDEAELKAIWQQLIAKLRDVLGITYA